MAKPASGTDVSAGFLRRAAGQNPRQGLVRNKAVYVALGVTPEGTKDILGLWIETSEGAKFWLRVMTELKNRGVEDILIAVVDGLKGFPEAIAAVFPPTIVQTCIVHLIRNSMDFASWKDRKPIAAELKAIYRATDADVARRALEDFDAGVWGRKYPSIAQSWRRNWEHVIPFFAFPVAVRRIIYTTNAIESLNAKLRRAVRTRGHFPTDEAAINCCISSCARSRRRGKCRHANGARQDPIRHHVRRQVRQSVMAKPAPHTRFLTSFNACASRRRSFTSSEVAARAVSPASRLLPASRNSFDQP